MSVINIEIVESDDQIISGIPRYITVSTNIPATIFYTLDGTTPDANSNVYVSTLELPTNLLLVILKLFATNGVDSSAVITNEYQTDITNSDLRLPRAAISGLSFGKDLIDRYPFGTNSPSPNFTYENNADAGITVDNPLLEQIPNGFDSEQQPSGFSNKPLTEYKGIYSQTNNIGEVGAGIGTFPTDSPTIGSNYPIEYTPIESDKSSLLFNPRALVIFQEADSTVNADLVHINRPNFSLENSEIVRDGAYLYNSGPDTPAPSGSFLKSYFNPRKNTLTFYYYDNSVHRWIISTTPFDPNNVTASNFSGLVFGREDGAPKVYRWIQYPRNVLT